MRRALAWAAAGTLLGCPRDVPAPVNDEGVALPIPSSSADAAFERPVDAAPRADDAPRAMAPDAWEVARGAWSFEQGEARCAGTTGSSVVYWKRDRPKDFDASIDVRFEVDESSAGIVFREVGDDFVANASFYQYEWYTRGTHHDRRLSLMIKNPYWVQIVDPIVREPRLGAWLRFRVRARGDRLETWIDGERVFDKTDATFARAGRIGLHVYQRRPVRFRDFRLAIEDAGTR